MFGTTTYRNRPCASTKINPEKLVRTNYTILPSLLEKIYLDFRCTETWNLGSSLADC